MRRLANRNLKVEKLEPRQLLAVFSVSNLNDSGPGSLRDAIYQANGTPGEDEIDFAVTGTIALTSGELEITDSLVINGPGRDLLTIDAQQLSRVLHYSNLSGDLTVANATLTGGATIGDNSSNGTAITTTYNGGGIRFVSDGLLTISDSVLDDNDVSGVQASGGAIFSESGSVRVIDSILTRNRSSWGTGGGIHSQAGDVEIIESLINHNFSYDNGGGVYAIDGNVTITESVLDENWADAAGSGGALFATGSMLHISQSEITNNVAGESGGGIASFSDELTFTDSVISGNISISRGGGGIISGSGYVRISRSTVADNNTSDRYADGGGIEKIAGQLIIEDSTISGNSTSDDISHGGGIFGGRASLEIIRSTITNNWTRDYYSHGGGIVTQADDITIVNSVIAGNSIEDLSSRDSDLSIWSDATPSVHYSLIGDKGSTDLVEAQTPDANGNLIGTESNPIDPLLEPLDDYGGPTFTHRPMPDSLLVNAGDPAVTFDPTEFDQRGEPFARVQQGRIDIGAVELVDPRAFTRFVTVDVTSDSQYLYEPDGNLSNDVPLIPDNNVPRGVTATSDGRVWVLDNDRHVYLYDADGGFVGRWRSDAAIGADGIATDGTNLWIVSRTTDQIHFFADGSALVSGDHEPTSSFALDPSNGDAFGLTTDGDYLWTVNDSSNNWKAYKYDTAGTALGSWDLDPLNRNPRGITLDPDNPGDLMVVNDANTDLVYRYEDAADLTSGNPAASSAWTLHAANESPQGIAVIASIASADFDADTDVDGSDFLAWQRGFGSTAASIFQGDADQNGVVDTDDLDVWLSQYGQPVPSPALSVGDEELPLALTFAWPSLEPMREREFASGATTAIIAELAASVDQSSSTEAAIDEAHLLLLGNNSDELDETLQLAELPSSLLGFDWSQVAE